MKTASFTPEQDLKILRLRADQQTFTRIAEIMGLHRESVRSRHRSLTASKAERPIRLTVGQRGAPIYDQPIPVVDDGHVDALVRLGGFTHRNQWSAA